ncbi:MAG: hypothetical protein ACMG5Z_06175 [Luteimonas sp.]
MSFLRSSLGALALELTPGSRAARTVIDQAAAGELAALMARDLGRVSAQAHDLDLAVLAGLFDPVELLRPRWPLHRELERLVAQAPGAGEPRIIAIAAREGSLPPNLQPQGDFAEGALRLMPFVLRGEGGIADTVDAQLESLLLDGGMAGADTALLAQQLFGASIEHARYLTLHDLAAMMAMQYDNVGLGTLWPLIEAALLAPDQEQWLDAAPEPLVRFAAGHAHVALFDPEAWARSGLAPAGLDGEQMDWMFERFQMRQRQIAGLLEAHGVPVSFDHCPAGCDPRVALRA